ncbi:YheC/YheD family protein [Paenibacillus sp. SC116]|uniref:YheC/YheD family endospore coat-associated protein n=1 Tax=Paenibacillus sp. SC116 TaxID=2968986 RepID=UPI00215AB3C1|nr:YheC/YheD family protein [Paenibacillus sp. SC116]MCR8842744.1 YheC/YheD family protein [Paenibacillus sp. SC116]
MSRSTRVHIQWTNKSADELALPSAFFTRWGLKDGQTYVVQVGGRSVKAVIRLAKEGNSSTIQLSRMLQKKLLLPSIQSLHMKYQNGSLRLGPVIGIVYARITDHSGLMLRHLSSHANVVVSFLPNEVNWSTGLIHGRSLSRNTTGENRVNRQALPIPDVIYNRIVPYKVYERPHVRQFLQKARTRRIPLFNPPFIFRKDTIHQYLMKHASIRSHLPASVIAPTLTQVTQLLASHQAVFFKPVTGSQGKGIYKIKKGVDGIFSKEARFNKRYMVSSSKDLSKLYHEVVGKHTRAAYLVQADVQLAKFNNDFFDFRVHLFKDGKHKWQISAIGANVFGSENVTTHGGWIKPVQEVLKPVFGAKATMVEKGILALSLQVANQVTKCIKQPVGEVALDIGVDQKGKAWLFEVNSKPGLHIYKHWKIKDRLNHSTTLLAEHCRAQAGF